MEPKLEEREAVATICLMAAFADGKKDESERGRLKEIFESLDTAFSASLYSRVLMGQIKIEDATSAISNPAMRNLAYEMAVGVCDADGTTLPEEQTFLNQLRVSLDLDQQVTQTINADGEALASMPLTAPDPVDALATVPATHSEETTDTGSLQPDATLDPMILKYAILNGGLELLPQSLATMAIVPLQTKMVYRVGNSFGFKLDQGHIREFLAVVGIGMTSQVLENYARKLMGGFLKKAVGKKKGKKLAKVTGAATGALMSFASTYALGHVAKVYYSGGRQLSSQDLKLLFSQKVEQGKLLFDQYKGDVENSARTTDLNSLLSMIKR